MLGPDEAGGQYSSASPALIKSVYSAVHRALVTMNIIKRPEIFEVRQPAGRGGGLVLGVLLG